MKYPSRSSLVSLGGKLAAFTLCVIILDLATAVSVKTNGFSMVSILIPQAAFAFCSAFFVIKLDLFDALNALVFFVIQIAIFMMFAWPTEFSCKPDLIWINLAALYALAWNEEVIFRAIFKNNDGNMCNLFQGSLFLAFHTHQAEDFYAIFYIFIFAITQALVMARIGLLSATSIHFSYNIMVSTFSAPLGLDYPGAATGFSIITSSHSAVMSPISPTLAGLLLLLTSSTWAGRDVCRKSVS